MDSSLGQIFLGYSADELTQLSKRVSACLEMLTLEQVWARGTENENAVGNLVLHLCGNVRQWIVSGVGGQPDVRDRQGEFAARQGFGPSDLRRRLEETVREAVAVLHDLPPERLTGEVTIQSYHLTVLEAIYHVVEHFAQHTGQIIFSTKQLTGKDLGFYRHLSSG